MSKESKIEWTDATWNPVRGCTKVSPGCAHCYAETFAERWRGVKGHPYEQGFDPRLVPGKLLEPLTWTTPRTIFVNSMSDLFHEDVPTKYIEAALKIMRMAKWHTFQILTKRSARMMDLLNNYLDHYALFDNIWFGVSVENRAHGKPRIKDLLDTEVRMKFLSIEPLLESLGYLYLKGLDWVIVGGESGAGARPMRQEWVEEVHGACLLHRVPFFFKQWGGADKKAAGRLLHGREYNGMPALDGYAVPSATERKALQEEACEYLRVHGIYWLDTFRGTSLPTV